MIPEIINFETKNTLKGHLEVLKFRNSKNRLQILNSMPWLGTKFTK